jgi:hypothetical protein
VSNLGPQGRSYCSSPHSAHLDFGSLWSSYENSLLWKVFGSSGHMSRVAQSIRLHDVYDRRAVKLPLEFEVVSPIVHIVFLFRATYRSGYLLLKHKELVLLFFGKHPCLTAIQQDRADLVENEFSWTSSISPLYFQTQVVVQCHQGSRIHKIFDDFKRFVAKSQALSNVSKIYFNSTLQRVGLSLIPRQLVQSSLSSFWNTGNKTLWFLV